jgi:putative salt-induced outer membrane protein YdiY
MRGSDFGALALTLLLAGVPDPGRGDRVTVKGTVLEGTVKSVGAKSVVLETVYGKGDLSIALEDVEAIETEGDFHVFHGDDVHTVGRVVGTDPEAIRIAGPDGEVDIPHAEVWDAARDPGPDAALLERLPVELPYWSGNVDLAFAATQATTETTALATALGLRRERGGSRLRLEASFQRATTRDAEDDESTTDVDESDEEKTADELRGFLRQEYDLDTRWFAFGSLEAEHDGIEELQYRVIPKAGPGYVVHESDTARFAVDAGGAFVYERFYDDSSNSYPAVAFGAESELKLPFAGATWRSRLDYTPSITDWMDDYQLRGETALLVPMTEGLSFKASVVDLYNSSPSDETQSNSLSTLLGLSLGF